MPPVLGNQQRETAAGTPNGQARLPSVSLPKGGGAIRGIGEKFAANPVTGTGSLTVPILTTPGRSGFGPQLTLSYDSGAGNGPFGLGWSLSLPAITRKTDKGLPKYQDVDESDVFILSGAEDLVPVLVEVDGGWQPDAFLRTVDGVDYTIQRYLPRIEGLFARIERWTNDTIGETHWRSISRDNVTTLYGRTGESRIHDPADPARVFTWLICETHDDKGNVIVYQYVPEDSSGIDLSQVHERNRTADSRSANRYLKRIKYGNQPSRLIEPDPSKMSWLFEVVFDFDEGHHEQLPIDAVGRLFVQAAKDKTRDWSVRKDPFSSYRAGYEVRTYRLCRRVLMFHHFAEELGTDDYLVRSTEFTYDQSAIASFITGVTQSGYVRAADGTYLRKSLPSLELQYSQAIIHEDVQEIDAESLENLPLGLDGARYQWVDLDGEGLSGILTEQADAWFYKPNLSDGKLGPLEVAAAQPSLAALNVGQQQLLDLAGDGQLDLVEFSGAVPGFYERTHDQGWERFTPFASLPNVAWDDPNLKFIDLTGDGHADVLVSEQDVLTWYPSLAETGFGPAEAVRQASDEEEGPRLIFADGTQSIYLADISGDGLIDLVRIGNGEVCYWPNLGYGRFGAKVTMDDAPWFDVVDLFDQRRVRLADIDGSGVTDIIYVGRDDVHIYFNQSGNGWSARRELSQFPQIDNLSAVTAVDLFGNGTACLVWSSPLPSDARRVMRYIDLMGGQKPHLLVQVTNNLGAETRVQYAPSTKFYLADKAAGKPWLTRLPFPVHAVERVETADRISRNRFVTRYVYHHGYFDGMEREFRGFGMVEQRDTEELAALSAAGAFPNATNLDAASHVPPVLTKTWYHTGALLEGEHISRQFEEEYYREGDETLGESGLTDQEQESMLLPDTELPATLLLPDGARHEWDLSADEARQACRALKGALLRQEVYGLDGSEEQDRPYTISERSYAVELLQPRASNPHAVFLARPRETINFHYERKLYDIAGKKRADPRVSHGMTLEVDGVGNILESVAIGYGRRYDDPDPLLTGEDKDKQKRTLITYAENSYAKLTVQDDPDVYRAPLLCESRTYELGNVMPSSNQPGITNLFRFGEVKTKVAEASDGDHDLPYEDVSGTGAMGSHAWRRPIEHVRTLYRNDDLTGPLSLGQLRALALPYESYKLAFTAALVAQVYGDRVSAAMLADEGKYVHSDGDANWWIPTGQVFYSANAGDTAAQELAFARQHFFLPRRFRDPFGNASTVALDGHDLLIAQTADPLGNTVQTHSDYRVVQPSLVTDPNGNRAEVAFDALGMVVATAVMGKEGESKGDSLAEFSADLDEGTLLAHMQSPLTDPHAVLQDATTRLLYDLFAYQRTQDDAEPQPSVVYALARETHVADLMPGELTKIQHHFSYSDGFEREIQKKIQAEPGPLVEGGADVGPRWVGSGWSVFNNKGNSVRQYEPFFSATHEFQFAKAVGVSPVLFYDPVERVVATLHPNHTWEKVTFDPWRQETWDVNDTVLIADPKADTDAGGFFDRLPELVYLPTWHVQRAGGGLGPQELDAADKAAAHAGTPTVAHFDTLGRTFLTVADNGAAGKYATRVELDIEGNQREVIDAKDRVVMRYDYDMLGNRLHQASMEAGERWTLSDVMGNPIRAWDSGGHALRTDYDALRRPVRAFVQGAAPQDPAKEILFQRTEYGEGQPSPSLLNLRTRVFRQCDGAGLVTNEEYDFKGNLLRRSRQLATNYKTTPDWSANPALDQEVFNFGTAYDALNRPVTLTTADESVVRPTYNEATLLERLEVNLRGAVTATAFVNDIDYDAKGQRELIEYGNGVRTTYDYDPLTFRLAHLQTLRGAERLQDFYYTYDPAGNITAIRDDAQQAIYFNNAVVEPHASYTYDAIYRLISATGREHIGQAYQPQPTWSDEFRTGLPHPNDGQAMRYYLERYQYDEVGNFLKMIHQANSGNWTRDYAYQEPSLIQAAKVSNRLSGTTVGAISESYAYDIHGNMRNMPHLPTMEWDFSDQLQRVDLGGGGVVYYVYDAARQRVRKVHEHNGGTVEERVYLPGFEIYRKRNSGGAQLERETLHIMDDKQRIAMVETKTLDISSPFTAHSSLIRYQLGNHLRSASLELDDAGQMISYEEYYPYGTTSYQAVRSGVEVSPKRYRYTGKERDEQTGFTYHGARYYAPWLGRWTATDPIGIGDGLSLYVYAKTNPLILRDPTGTENKPVTENDKTIKQMKDPQLYRYLKNLEQRSPEKLAEFTEHTTGWFRRRAEGMVNKYGMVREYPLTITGDKPEEKRPDPGEVKDDPHVAEAFTGSVKKTQQDFGSSHPLEALAMARPGGLDEKREVSIAAAAYRLSSAATSGKDPQFNAVRHAIWMAQSTADFGEEIAREAGYAHEGEIPDLTLREVKYESASDKEGASLKADTIADLLNNVLGRKIGKENPGVFSKEMSLRVLEYYHSHGLYEVKETAGKYSISQNKLEPEAYKRAVEAINALEEEGLTAQELENIRQRE